MTEMANKAKNKLEELGNDIEKAIRDAAMQKILEGLANAVVKRNRKVIDALVGIGKRAEKLLPDLKNDVEDLINMKFRGFQLQIPIVGFKAELFSISPIKTELL